MTLQEFTDMLNSHDWYFNYSDDSKWYNRGLQQRKAIDAAYQNLKAQGLEQEAKDLFNDLSPDGFQIREPRKIDPVTGNWADLS